MLAKESLQRLALELETPGQNATDQHRDAHYCCHKDVVIGYCRESWFSRNSRQKIKSNSCHKQGNREMDQHDMLYVLREQRGLYVKRIQIGAPFYFTTMSPDILGWIEQM